MNPYWWKYLTFTPPASSHFKVTYILTRATHDGYCSGMDDEDDSIEWHNTTCIGYLPLSCPTSQGEAKWDFSKKKFTCDNITCKQDYSICLQSGWCGLFARVALQSVVRVSL